MDRVFLVKSEALRVSRSEGVILVAISTGICLLDSWIFDSVQVNPGPSGKQVELQSRGANWLKQRKALYPISRSLGTSTSQAFWIHQSWFVQRRTLRRLGVCFLESLHTKIGRRGRGGSFHLLFKSFLDRICLKISAVGQNQLANIPFVWMKLPRLLSAFWRLTGDPVFTQD